MAFIFSFLKKYRIAAVSAISMMLIELAVELVQPLLISKIIDDGISKGQMPVVWLWGAVLLTSALIAFATGIPSSFMASHASQGFGYDLRDRLYEKVEKMAYPVFSRFAASSLITRLTGDVVQLQDMVFMSLRFATRVPLVLLGSMIMALTVSVKLGLILTVLVPVILIFVMYMIKRTSVMFRKVQQRLDSLNGVIQENLTGMRLIRVFVRRNHEAGRFDARSKELMDGTLKALRLAETTMLTALLVMNMGIIAVLWLSRADISAGQATVGEAVAVANYSLRTIGALSALSWIMTSYSRASASAQRIGEVMETEEEEDEDEVTKEHGRQEAVKGAAEGSGRSAEAIIPAGSSIAFAGVGFRYPDSDMKVLEEVSFTVRAGQRAAIMGATGSGKSSLVQLLPRLQEPTQGEIRVNGQDIRQLDRKQLLDSIGYVPQEVVLFSGTVRENIAWGRTDATLDQIKAAARQAQIHDTIESLPHGYDTVIGQRGVNLSGGQKQRLQIARALVRQPAILILDDSTSALDTRTEAALMKELDQLSCTTFLITQKVSTAASADLVLLLDDGRLIASGMHEELLEKSQLYRRIAESQHREGDQAHVQGIR